MEYRRLGNSGLEVSLAGLGTNNFGRRCDEAGSRAVVYRALDLGINFIDTADNYGGGLSEQYVGRAIRGCRRDVVIATKFERPRGQGPMRSGTSRRYIMEAVQSSLRRLGVSYIDLYQIHYWSSSAPIEETMRALDDLVQRGNVRYIGCSNFTAWQMLEAQWVARTEHLTPLISAQHGYNLLDRVIEAEVVPVAQRYGLGIIPYLPLASGFLTGKYRPNQPPPEDSRLTQGDMWSRRATERVLTPQNFAQLAKLKRFAEERHYRVGELALAWLGSQPFVGSVIAGATRPEQVEENVRALDWRLGAHELAELDALLDQEEG